MQFAVSTSQVSSRIKNFLLAISVLLAIAAVIYLSSKSRLAATGFETAISLVYIVLVGGGSIYKVSQWWRSRHNPSRSGQAASLSQT